MSGLYGFTSPLWPIRYKPLPDELLSSWIVRLAHGHGMKVQPFCNRLFGNTRQVWNRDVDRLAPAWLLEALATHTGTPACNVFATTLRRYEGVLYERFRSSGHLHWVQVMQMYHRKRMGYGQQYCPQCLRGDPTPYYRTRWRLSIITVCSKHRCMLLDQCLACGSPVSFHRVDTGLLLDNSRDLAGCVSCGSDLSANASTVVPIYNVEAFQWLVAMVARVEQGELAHQGILAVLHHMIYLMLSSSSTIHLNEYVAGCLGVVPLSFSNGKRTSVEALPVLQRHQLLIQAAWLMAELAPRLMDAWRSRAIRYNHLHKDFSGMPAWYQAILEKVPHNSRGGLYAEALRR